MKQMTSLQGFHEALALGPGSLLDHIPALQLALLTPGPETCSVFTQMSGVTDFEHRPSVIDQPVLSLLQALCANMLEAEFHFVEIENAILDSLEDSRVIYLSEQGRGDAFLMPMEMFLDRQTTATLESSGQDFWLIYRIDTFSETSVTLRLASATPRAEDDLPGSPPVIDRKLRSGGLKGLASVSVAQA